MTTIHWIPSAPCPPIPILAPSPFLLHTHSLFCAFARNRELPQFDYRTRGSRKFFNDSVIIQFPIRVGVSHATYSRVSFPHDPRAHIVFYFPILSTPLYTQSPEQNRCSNKHFPTHIMYMQGPTKSTNKIEKEGRERELGSVQDSRIGRISKTERRFTLNEWT